MSVNEYDEGQYQAIESAVEASWIEEGTPAYGVAQQFIHRGYDSLSAAQRTIYKREIIPTLMKVYEAQRIRAILDSAAP